MMRTLQGLVLMLAIGTALPWAARAEEESASSGGANAKIHGAITHEKMPPVSQKISHDQRRIRL